MENKQLIELLSKTIGNMTMAMPLLEKMDGKIPTEILDMLDFINKLSVKY